MSIPFVPLMRLRWSLATPSDMEPSQPPRRQVSTQKQFGCQERVSSLRLHLYLSRFLAGQELSA